MKATEAKSLTKTAEEEQQRKQAEAWAEEDRRKREANERYMREKYSSFEAEVYKKIKDAAKRGERYIHVTDPKGVAWEVLRPKLVADGYHIEPHWVAGEYENMGDFNAPCNIWHDPYWYYTVSW